MNWQQIWDLFVNWLERDFTLGNYSLNAYQIIIALLILIIGSIILKLLSRTLVRVTRQHSRMQESHIYTLSRLFNYTGYVILLLLALSAINISFQNLALVAGALSVGIGFGLQNIVNNFVSGIILLFEHSLRVGDFVELENGLQGEVKEIKIRSTLIRTLGNEDILVPNSQFINSQVNNWTLDDDYRRMAVQFGVAYGTDPRLVIEAVGKAAAKHPIGVQEEDKLPGVIFTGFGDSSLDFKLVVWIKGEMVRKPGLVISEFLLVIHDVLKEHDIEVPFPQRDLHLRSGFVAPDVKIPSTPIENSPQYQASN